MPIKKVFTIFLIVAGILIVLSFIKNIAIKSAITHYGSKIIGAQLEIGSLSVGVLTQRIHIEDLKLYNPPGFPPEVLVDIHEININYRLLSYFKGTLYFPYILFDMKEVVIIRNKEGKLNVDALKVVEETKAKDKEGDPNVEPAAPQPKAAELAIKIDLMKLNVEQVVVKDFSKSKTNDPLITVHQVGLKNKEYKNITNVSQMVALVLASALGETAIKNAGIYGAAAILGAGFLPAGIIGVIVGKDNAYAEFDLPYEHVYQTCLDFLMAKGVVKTHSQEKGIIRGKFNDFDIIIKVKKKDKRKVIVNVQARKFMLPKSEAAGGLLYQLKDLLN